MWHAYAAYNPNMVVQLLEIFRVWYNFVRKGKDGLSPAQRLGLAQGEIREDHILGFDLRKAALKHFEAGR